MSRTRSGLLSSRVSKKTQLVVKLFAGIICHVYKTHLTERFPQCNNPENCSTTNFKWNGNGTGYSEATSFNSQTMPPSPLRFSRAHSVLGLSILSCISQVTRDRASTAYNYSSYSTVPGSWTCNVVGDSSHVPKLTRSYQTFAATSSFELRSSNICFLVCPEIPVVFRGL